VLYFLAGCCRELDPVLTSMMKVIIWGGLSRTVGGRGKEEQAGKGGSFFQVTEQSDSIYPTPKPAILSRGGTCCVGSESYFVCVGIFVSLFLLI